MYYFICLSVYLFFRKSWLPSHPSVFPCSILENLWANLVTTNVVIYLRSKANVKTRFFLYQPLYEALVEFMVNFKSRVCIQIHNLDLEELPRNSNPGQVLAVDPE